MEHIVSKRCFIKKKHPHELEIKRLKKSTKRLETINEYLETGLKVTMVLTTIHILVESEKVLYILGSLF